MDRSPAFVIGFMVGIAAVAVVSAILALIVKRKTGKAAACKYDERQQLVRGKAYQSAFFVLFGYLVAAGGFGFATGIIWCDIFTYSLLGVCLSATVFATRCIWHSAYFSLQENPRFYIVLFSATAALNLVLGALNLSHKESFVSDGQLTFLAVNPIISVMFLFLLVVLLIKRFADSRTVEE